MNRLEQPIVCVADDKNEVAPLRHVLRVAGISNRFYIVTNGQQAIAYLASAARLRNGETNRFPCLVLLA